MTGTPFIGLDPFQWIALLIAAMTLLLLADALAGHYRSGFAFRSQYAPFVSGGLLIVSAVAAGVAPGVSWTKEALHAAGWLAVASGVIGFGFHHYYGIMKKPGGYKWLIHYIFHGHDRGGELLDAIRQGSATVVERLGRITGYSTGIGWFSHAVAETNDDLKALIGAATVFLGPGFLVPSRNGELFRWCLSQGLRVSAQATLMTIGLYNEPAGAYLPSILY